MHSALRTIFPYSLVALLIAGLTACAQVSYYAQSVKGHFKLVAQKQSIEEYLQREDIDPLQRQKLQLVQQARSFAAEALKLPVKGSYSEYVHLQRDYAVLNLIAAQEFSTELHAWCYPLIGCANYKGYFDTEMLERDQSGLQQEGYDTYVYKVTAYSTLGWFDDPVLSTFLALPEYRLVGLLFHELAHQQVYISGDTAFNESFATAVEQSGLELFYANHNESKQLEHYVEAKKMEEALITLAGRTRVQLQTLYAQPMTEALKRAEKKAIFKQFEQNYRALATKYGRENGTDFPGEYNNARLGVLSTYHNHVPGFLNLLQYYAGAFSPFYAHVRKLGRFEQDKRQKCLDFWAEPGQLRGDVEKSGC